MKILVVEDDENKRNQIVDFINEVILPVEIITANSYQSGLKVIRSQVFDLIILDMTMPTFDISSDENGGRPQAYAGRDILRQMERHDIIMPVIIVTQFDKFGSGHDELSLEELHDQLVEENLPSYKGVIFYNASITDWKKGLQNLISNLT
jgi:CheY-like chemotaxis protein